MTLTQVGHFHGQPPGFNHRAAEAVYDVISQMDDDTAEVVSDLIIGSAFQSDLVEHGPAINKALDAYLDEHGDALRDSLTRSYVAKRASGQPIDGLIAAAEVIAKDFTGPGNTPQARAERARKQQKDLVTGRFVQTHHEVGYDTHDDEGKRLKPADDAEARRMGIKRPKGELTGPQKLAYQQAYAQVQALLMPYQRDTEGAFLHLHYPNGEEVHAVPERGDRIPLDPARKLRAISVSRIPRHADLDTYDTLGALRGAVATNYQTGVGPDGTNAGVQRVRDFGEAVHGGDPFSGGSRLMTRLGAGSKALDESFQNSEGKSVLPRRVQAALKAGTVVGTYGPEAQKVIGPAADRAAYRYRGIERPTPDRSLMNAMESLRRDPTLTSAEDRRELAVHGKETDGGWHPSGVLQYFRSQLPNATLNALQRKSGTIPPSEGVILDRKGRVVVQSVGYADDHYLPFDLTKLKQLRGGEYIRTRTWGGPTTEDIYTGLISGAKSTTVVSHNGVYTVEFDPSFKGRRRYNDKAGRMVARYGYLLDAVKNGEITTGQIDPSRIAEIEEEAGSSYDRDLDPEAFDSEVTRLMSRERRNPMLSANQKAEAAQSFLDQQALKHRTPDGSEMTRTELVDQWIDRKAVGQHAAYLRLQADTAGEGFRIAGSGRAAGMSGQGIAPGLTIGDMKRTVAEQAGLNDADPTRFSQHAITAMGLGEQFDRYLEREESTYRASLRPLELNGAGYQLALEALQEQFPYYIKSVDYHPWHDAKNAVDTGYVKPKHNRPARALAGYFDPSINGTGKVHADSIRGQGHARTIRPYQSPQARVAERAREAANTVTGGRIGTPAAAGDVRELRYSVDNDLLRELRSHDRFGGGLEDTSGKFGLLSRGRGEPITEHRDSIRDLSPDLHDVLFGDEAALKADPERLHEKLGRALEAAIKYKTFDINDAAVKAFRNEGRIDSPTRFERSQVGENLRGLNDEHDFGQRLYDPSLSIDVEEIERHYAIQPQIQALVKNGLGPLDDGFEQRADLAQHTLEVRHRALLDWVARGSNPLQRPKDSEKLPFEVEGLARAKQLRRRQLDAIKATEEPVDETGLGFTSGGNNLRIELVYPDGSTGGTLQQVNDRQEFDSLLHHNGMIG